MFGSRHADDIRDMQARLNQLENVYGTFAPRMGGMEFQLQDVKKKVAHVEMRLDRAEKAREIAASSPPPSDDPALTAHVSSAPPPGFLPPPVGASLTAHLADQAPVYTPESNNNAHDALPQVMPSQQ